MELKQASPKITRKLNSIGLALGFWALLSGCSLMRPQELSFAGPEIQGVRAFHLVSPGSDDPTPLFYHVRDLGPVLQWSPDGEQVLVERERGSFYLADPESGQIGICLTCSMTDARTAYFSPDGEFVAVGAQSGLYLAACLVAPPSS